MRIITRTWRLVDWPGPLAFGSWLPPLAFTSRLALGFWHLAFGTWLSALIIACYFNNEALRPLVKQKGTPNRSLTSAVKLPSASAANLAKIFDAAVAYSTKFTVSAGRSLQRLHLRVA